MCELVQLCKQGCTSLVNHACLLTGPLQLIKRQRRQNAGWSTPIITRSWWVLTRGASFVGMVESGRDKLWWSLQKIATKEETSCLHYTQMGLRLLLPSASVLDKHCDSKWNIICATLIVRMLTVILSMLHSFECDFYLWLNDNCPFCTVRRTNQSNNYNVRRHGTIRSNN